MMNWLIAIGLAALLVPFILAWMRRSVITADQRYQQENDYVTGHEERCDVCGKWHQYMTRFNSPHSTWDELVCDDCLSKDLH